MVTIEQTTEKVSAAEYIGLLEADQLFPLTDDERLEAVRLAKQYTGRLIVKEWKVWRKSETGGFLVFAKNLPERIRKEERDRINKDREAPVSQTAVAKLFEDFRKQHRIPSRVQENTPERKQELASDGLPAPKIGYIDPVLGWCVGGMPVF